MLIYILFISIFFLDFAAQSISSFPRIFTWIPEILSGFALLLIIFTAIQKRVMMISPLYLMIFLFLAFVCIASAIANAVQPGAVFAGLRSYLKYIPFFFIPVVLHITDEKLLSQLKFISLLVFLQVPIALYQRFFQHARAKTGDVVIGSLNTPSVLTIVSLSAIAILLSAYYKKLIKLPFMIIMVVLLLMPPTLNETTITIIFLPLAFIIPTLVFARQVEDKRQILAVMVLAILSLFSFVGAYNIFYGDRWDGSIVNLLTEDDMFEESLVKDDGSGVYDDSIGTRSLMKGDNAKQFNESGKREVGRLDSILLAYDYLSKYPTKFAMGVGVGNAAQSFSEKLRGEYSDQYLIRGGDITALSRLLWEMGVVGVVLVVVIFMMILFDSYYLSCKHGIYGALSMAWLVVTCFILISLSYKDLIAQNALGYMFWYLSGCIVAEKFRARNI